MGEKLLTILIPVYNGERYLPHLLGMFVNAYNKMPEQFAEVEIIVANNVSTDKTGEIAENFTTRLPMLCVPELTHHLPTAEENVFRSFAYCKGKFTWALGVDDIPNFQFFASVIAMLQKDEFDFYLFNFPTVSPEMELTRTCNFYIADSERPMNLVDMTQRFGFWYTVAGISGQIMRTECVKNYNFNALIENTGKIYAHVSAYLHCFRDKKAVSINKPLIFYKVTMTNMAHWRNAAKVQNVFDEYFWTLGYIRQLKFLEAKGIIPPDYLKYMLEINETTLFRPIYVMADKFANQIRIMSFSKEKRNQLTREEFDEVFDYLLFQEPFLREFFWRLRAIHEMLLNNKKVKSAQWRELDRYSDVIQKNYMLASLLYGVVGDYEIYRIANRYYAVERHARKLLVERLLYLDEEFPPSVFVAATEAELRAKLYGYLQSQRTDSKDGLSHIFEITTKRLAYADQELLELYRRYDMMRYSSSWRITMPLRVLAHAIRRIKSFAR